MKRLLWLALIAAPLFAQPATTTVADQLYMAIGGPTYCQGTITLSWSDFYSEDGYMVKAGTLSTPVNSTGQFSVLLVPTNTNTTPASGIYNIRYNLQPAGCAATSESWNVPSGGGPVDLNNVRTLPSPPPSLIPVTSLAPPIGNAAGALCYNGMYVLWGTSCTSGGSAITGSGTNGKIAKFTGSTTIGNAAYADIVANWTGCTGSEYLGFDGNCHTPISQLTAAAIIALWSGCTGTQYLGADGSCHATGSGTVTTFSAGTLSPLFTTSVATSTTTPALTFALTNAAGDSWFGNASGTSGAPSYNTSALPNSLIPVPTLSALGGVEAIAAVTHKWLVSLSTSGIFTETQPACADLSTAAGGCSMSTTAGGDLSGTLPSPTVTNGSNITNSSIPNSGLANPSMTVGGATCTLGGSCTPSSSGATFYASSGFSSGTFSTTLNQSSTTGDFAPPGSLVTFDTVTSTDYVPAWLKTAPSTPWTETVQMSQIFQGNTFQSAGLVTRYSSGTVLIFFRIHENGNWYISSYPVGGASSGSTLQSGAYGPGAASYLGKLDIWLRCVNNGTTITFQYSFGGQTWITAGTALNITSTFGAAINQVGVGSSDGYTEFFNYVD